MAFPSSQLQGNDWPYSPENQLLVFASDHTRAVQEDYVAATDPVGLAVISYGPLRNRFVLMRMKVADEKLFWDQAQGCVRRHSLQQLPVTVGWAPGSSTWSDALSAVSAREYGKGHGQREQEVRVYFTRSVLPHLLDVARSLPPLEGSSQASHAGGIIEREAS